MIVPVLHSYWRSSAAYRVRIALNLKGVIYTQVTHDLRVDAQNAPEYRAVAPHGLVPALEVGESILIESPAILEWIETQWPTPRLLPIGDHDKAVVRAMAALISCDIHPLNNLRVLNDLRREFAATEDQVQNWSRRWITAGLSALERMVEKYGGNFAFGETPTLADCFLVPQLYSAGRFGIDCSDYSRLLAVGEAAGRIPAVRAAHPNLQPDAQP